VRDYSALIEKHRKLTAASAGFLNSFMNQQPPSELLIAILPAIEELVAAGNRSLTVAAR
jgi:hypothetical protein